MRTYHSAVEAPRSEAGPERRRRHFLLPVSGLFLVTAAPLLPPAASWLLAVAGLLALAFAGAPCGLSTAARTAGLLAAAAAPLTALGVLPLPGLALLFLAAAALALPGRGGRAPRPGPAVLAGGLGLGLLTLGTSSGLAPGPRAEVLTVSLLLGCLLGGLLAAWPRLRRAGGRLGTAPAALLPAACAALVPAVLAPAPPERAAAPADWPEIVLVTLDTTRGDRWDWVQAADRALRPGAEALEARSVVFTAATATAALTAPAHASLLTGLHPHGHGVFNNGGVLRLDATLPALLRRAGYRTLAAPSVVHLDPAFGFGTGFDAFAGVETGPGAILRRWRGVPWADALRRLFPVGRLVRPGEATLAEAARLWREAAGPRPRFLWVHLFEPHWPWEAPEEILAEIPEEGFRWPEAPTPGFAADEVRKWQRAYDAEILHARRLLEDFLAGLRTEASGRPFWVIGTADHGEALGEHGSVDHGDLLYEEQLRVPLWVQAPGWAREPDGHELQRVRTVATPVSHVDLLPSLGEILGLELPPGLPGRSWAPALRGRPLATVPVYASTRHAAFDNHMVRLGRLKMIVQARKEPTVMLRKPGRRPRGVDRSLPWLRFDLEAYDLERDPLELRPLPDTAGRDYPEAGPAGEALRAFEEERGPPPELFAPRQNPDRDVLQALRGLGYAGGAE